MWYVIPTFELTSLLTSPHPFPSPILAPHPLWAALFSISEGEGPANTSDIYVKRMCAAQENKRTKKGGVKVAGHRRVDEFMMAGVLSGSDLDCFCCCISLGGGGRLLPPPRWLHSPGLSVLRGVPDVCWVRSLLRLLPHHPLSLGSHINEYHSCCYNKKTVSESVQFFTVLQHKKNLK